MKCLVFGSGIVRVRPDPVFGPPLLTVSWVHLLTPSSQHAIVSPSAAYRAVRNSTQSVDSSPPMKRQRSLKVELVVSSPCRQIRGQRAAGDGARFTFQLDLPAGHLVLPMQTEHAYRQDSIGFSFRTSSHQGGPITG
jgi:hypothetical protein